jgi:hypothetical protein
VVVYLPIQARGGAERGMRSRPLIGFFFLCWDGIPLELFFLVAAEEKLIPCIEGIWNTGRTRGDAGHGADWHLGAPREGSGAKLPETARASPSVNVTSASKRSQMKQAPGGLVLDTKGEGLG